MRKMVLISILLISTLLTGQILAGQIQEEVKQGNLSRMKAILKRHTSEQQD